MKFADFYMSEKTIKIGNQSPDEQKCVEVGQRIAKRFDLMFNGWMEVAYLFSIPSNVPDAGNTLGAKNEIELAKKLKERFPAYFSYILKKNFPNGYRPDPTIPTEPPAECEPMNREELKAYFARIAKES